MKKNRLLSNPAYLFVLRFIGLFGLLYSFYIVYLSLTTPGGLYIAYLDEHLNFISGFRHFLIGSSAALLNFFGYQTRANDYQLLITGHNILYVGFDCLGFGIMCFFVAFVAAYTGNLRSKIYFTYFGLIVIQSLNVARFVLLGLFWKRAKNIYLSDHHTIFNIIVYIFIAVSLYYYIRYQDKQAVKSSKKIIDI